MEDLSGRSFGVYRVVEPLGAGGMASVYKAYQPAVDRYVALKILPSHLAQDPEFLARFKQEARVLAKLQHPHILPVHDFGEADGFTFIVMPFIKTGTLAAALRGQPLPFDQIKRVITQVGDALDCAHTQGLVHRDVKPSNILLDERGNCLLADFGIAKILEGADKLTATGGLVGTPKYMSPEQGMGNPLDGRSDVYSLGVVLYEMATGQVPFRAETPMAVVVKHIRDPLPVPRQVNPEIPEPLQRMIFSAMHKEPSERFASAGQMVAAMTSLQLGAAADFKEAAPTVPMRTPDVASIIPSSVPDGPPTVLREASPTVPVDGSAAAGDATLPMQGSSAATPAAGPEAAGPAIGAEESAPGAGLRWQWPTAAGVVLVALLLLIFLWPGGDPESQPTQALGRPVAGVPASTPDPGPVPFVSAPSEDPDGGSPEPTSPARVVRSDDTTGAEETLGSAPVGTGELLISVDAASTLTLDGEAIGHFEPGVPRTIAAPAGQHLVIATAEDGVTVDQAVIKVDVGAREVVALEIAAAVGRRADDVAAIDRENERLAALARAEQDARLAEAEAAARDPFPDRGDGIFLDRQVGLRWTVASSPTGGTEGLLWTEANAYCEALELGGQNDWRLPTRPELDSVLQRLDPTRFPWGLTLWSADRAFGESNRLWVTNSPLYAPSWSSEVRDASARRLTHRAVCVA